MDRTLKFSQNQRLIADKTEYQVIGSIEFSTPSDGSSWVEYCIKETGSGKIRWLSIDNLYEEYAIYTQCPYSSELSPDGIQRAGFREADSGTARVVRCSGRVDASPGDQVNYVEYVDGQEEKIISVETWEDETEYSTGWYLDFEEITPLGQGAPERAVKPKAVFPWIWLAVILLFFGGGSFFYLQNSKTPIKKFLSGSPDFTYQTSVTSDLNNREKADVYETHLTIEAAAKCVIAIMEGKTEEVQSGEDGSVAILTKREYCFIYTGTEGEVLVQISSRDYVRQSTNTLYHSHPYSHSYYRGFYYSRGYFKDRGSKKNSVDGFVNYSGDTVSTNPDDPYKSYSDSIRQSSVRSRTSSGGGISSGK